jgi:hypothetical protein
MNWGPRGWGGVGLGERFSIAHTLRFRCALLGHTCQLGNLFKGATGLPNDGHEASRQTPSISSQRSSAGAFPLRLMSVQGQFDSESEGSGDLNISSFILISSRTMGNIRSPGGHCQRLCRQTLWDVFGGQQS